MALSQTEVSKLYVSIFGRASEGEGNNYWQDKGNMSEVADQMLNTDAAKGYFGDTLKDNQAFIEFIYKNTLNKTIEDDAEGIAYWVKQLENKSKGEVATDLIDAISLYAPGGEFYNENDEATVNAYNQFTNRVEVSNYFADTVKTAPTDYATSTAFNGDLIVTFDNSTIVDAKSDADVIAVEEDNNTSNNDNFTYH